MAMLKRIYIEISNICNLQCSFCPVVGRENEIMSKDAFEKVIRQAAPLAEEVCLHLMGEPLAHPEIADIIGLCREYRAPVQLTTNGVNIAQREKLLLSENSLRQINFSIQSYKDNFPGKNLADYAQPIFEFSKKLMEAKPETYINYRLWNTHENKLLPESENEDFFQLVEEYFGLEINRRIQVESIKSKRLKERLYLHFDSRFEWPSMKLPFQGNQGRCHALISHIGVHADGTVVPCCLDKEAQIPLGNCLITPLKEILESERARTMKEGFENGKLTEELCQHCTYINRFKK